MNTDVTIDNPEDYMSGDGTAGDDDSVGEWFHALSSQAAPC